MNKTTKWSLALMAATLMAGGTLAAEIKLTLSGANEVPPVTTAAGASGTIQVADDGTVSGSITTHDIAATMAHIHKGAMGQNGPVIVKLEKDGDAFKVPAGARLDADQLAAFKAGDLYVNVHSEAHKGGEIRGQLK